MTVIVLTSGRWIDVDLPAHTVIALRIEATRRGDTHLHVAGRVIRLADIDHVTPEFFLDREQAA